MSTARPDTYTAASGGGVFAGIPDQLPAWLEGAVLNQWGQISNTAGPSELQDYSGAGFRDDGTTTEFVAALGGGHAGNVTTNRVMALDLTADVPAWAQVKASGNFTGYSSDTMTHLPSDGSPGPRHLYNAIVWSSAANDYVFGGRYYAFDGSDDGGPYTKIDGYNRAGNAWRAAGYYPARQETFSPFSVVDPATGIIYASEGQEGTAIGGFQMDGTTRTISAWHNTSGANCGRGPNAWDTNRSKCFQLGPQTYEVWASTLCSLTIAPDGTKQAISFNSSAAYTAFTAEVANYLSPAMVYHSAGDCFYWYNGDDGRGAGGKSNRVFKITPNGTSTWDMSIIDGGGAPPATRSSISGFDGTKYTSGNFSGTNSQLGIIERWGVLVLVRPGQNVHYLKVVP